LGYGSGVGGGGAGGASAPLKVLICQKSEQIPENMGKFLENLANSLKIRTKLLKIWTKWPPTFAEKHTKTFFGGHSQKRSS